MQPFPVECQQDLALTSFGKLPPGATLFARLNGHGAPNWIRVLALEVVDDPSADVRAIALAKSVHEQGIIVRAV